MYDNDYELPEPSGNYDGWTIEELKAETERHRVRLNAHRSPNAARWSAQDYIESGREIMQMRASGRRPDTLHPLTAQRLQSRSNWHALDLAREILASMYGEHWLREDDMQVLAMAASGSSILGDLFSKTANSRLFERMPRLLDKELAVCVRLALSDYRPVETGAFELEIGIDDATDKVRQWQTLAPVATSESLALVWSPFRLRFTLQVVANDEPGLVPRVTDAVAIAAAQNEKRRFCGVLNDNANLKDGEALFRAGDNLLTDEAYGSIALSKAIQMLRKQTLNGQATDAEPFALLVPASGDGGPYDEGEARKVLQELYGDGERPRLIPSAYLDDNAWYLMADPAAWPTIGRATLDGGPSLRLSPGRPNAKESDRDVILEGIHAYQYQALARTGLVKIAFAH